ncbi:hypothetical protein PMKS-001152 [Pichia membranifaciens]|uniref:K Homology domain-containing protein n=1 Tax=Pichia membranifaciens TaxID=4926 RepID=A0A1Q2YDT4_9ASCO|nr:hypothetical protein PMKS-001152 [Pichia membranifaciens]
MLKRKNEESEESKESTHYVKRVALDAEAVERKDVQDDKQKTSVSLSGKAGEAGVAEDDEGEEREGDDDNDRTESVDNNDDMQGIKENSGNDDAFDLAANSADSGVGNGNENEAAGDDIGDSSKLGQTPSSVPSKGDFAAPKADNDSGNNTQQQHGGPISSHRVQNDDPTYVHFRMLANISDTASIVGKGGEAISKIKEQSNARVNVSENLKGVPERIISVRGSAEYVAKAFGLIVRTINNERFDESSNIDSKSYNLRLLFPHTVMGYIIGKKGSRFREIEENSAAALRANDQILPASTDRILNINGVADAIHIATYYVAQTVIEHKQQISKAVYYNPANFNQPVLPALSMNQNHQHNNNGNNRQFAQNGYNHQQNMMGMGNPNQMLSNMYNQNPMKMLNSPTGFAGMMHNGMSNNMGMMGAPQNSAAGTANTTPGDTITGPDGKINQELFVPQKHIGLVIGRGGKNLKDIRQSTGCYVKVNDEVPGAPDRKLTLIGNVYGIQNAIVLINNKIENEKLRQQREGHE